MVELPSHVKRVESHIKWIQDFVQILESSRSKLHVERILLSTKGSEIKKALALDDNFLAEYNNQNPKYISYFATWFNHAAMSCYLGEFERAHTILDKLEISLEQLLSNDEYHGRVLKGIKYVLGTMAWAISELHLRNNKDGAVGEQLEQWEIIQEDNVALATIEFLKGSLAGYLGIAAEDTLAYFQKSVELDPDYFVWYHYLYRKMREMRRAQKFSKSNQQQQQKLSKGPTKEEREIAEMAYEKSFNIFGEMNLLASTDLILVLKENLSGLASIAENAHMAWEKENEADYQKCSDLISEGMKIAKEKDLKKWISTFMILQAEFLLYLKPNDHEKQEMGKKLLFECLEKYPDARIHQKIGKLHQQIANTDVTQIWRYREARRHFAESLRLDPANFGCLKAYMRLLNNIPDRQNGDYLESVTTLRKCITVATKDYQLAELHMLLGCVLWIFNPEFTHDNKRLACEEWLHVAKYLPGFLDDLIKHLANPPFKVSYKKVRRDPVYINFKKIMSELIELRKIRIRFTTCKETLGHIDVFYDKLKPYVDSKNEQLKAEEQENIAVATVADIGNGQQRRAERQERQTRLNFKCESLADMDNNWRRSGK